MARTKVSKTLSDILLKRNVLAPEVLKAAEAAAEEAGLPLERYVMENDLAPQTQMTLAISEYLDMPPISLMRFSPSRELLDSIPKEVLAKHHIIPVARTGNTLTVALGDPFDILAIDQLHTLTGLEITPLASSEQEVRSVLERTRADEAGALNMEDIMSDAGDDLQMGHKEEADLMSLEEMKESAEDGPVIRMVNMILVEAVKLSANDIHIEPQEHAVRLRYRVDGVLIERPNLPKALQSAIISRVKIMAELDIGENRVPQDGRFRIKTLGKTIDVRVSVLPTIFGGKIVMRTLDKSSLFPNLSALGLDKRAYDAMSYAIEQPHGIVLITGPTGSGKTTTLYSCLQELNKLEVNLVTCEDPVEYQIPGIIQVRINADAGCTFAAALRAILRQDPDIVLIGEIRDVETAEIAIKAALTGHLVLTTLHANDAASTITRLVDMGLEPFLLASSLILAQAQRLYRRLCSVCKKELKKLPQDLLKENFMDETYFEGHTLYEAVGCPKCRNVGYRGRGAIMEVLAIDDKIKAAIVRQAVADEIRDIAQEQGMLSLRTAMLDRVKQGDTSLAVAFRTTRSEE